MSVDPFRRVVRPAAVVPSFIAVMLLLAGCTNNLITSVSEFDANEAVSVLMRNGVDARKVASSEQGYDVVVPKGDVRRGLDVLVDAGLPRERRASLGELFKKEGLVSSAAEERIRYAFGVSQELERTIASIEGVASARVHVVIPQSDPMATVARAASASIFVRYREPGDPAVMGPVVRGIVVRAVEGLSPERVSIAFSPAAVVQSTAGGGMRSVFGLRVAADSFAGLLVALVLPWLLLAVMVGHWFYRTTTARAIAGAVMSASARSARPASAAPARVLGAAPERDA